MDWDKESRSRLEVILSSFDDYYVSRQFDNWKDLEINLKRITPDIIFTEIDTPVSDFLLKINKIKAVSPSSRVIVYSGLYDFSIIMNSIEAGADGYIFKQSNLEEIFNAILNFRNGGAPLSNQITSYIITSLQRNYDNPLTRRELEIIGLLSHGKTSRQISDELFISSETVRTHIKNIYKKLSINSKAELIMLAKDMRWI